MQTYQKFHHYIYPKVGKSGGAHGNGWAIKCALMFALARIHFRRKSSKHIRRQIMTKCIKFATPERLTVYWSCPPPLSLSFSEFYFVLARLCEARNKIEQRMAHKLTILNKECGLHWNMHRIYDIQVHVYDGRRPLPHGTHMCVRCIRGDGRNGWNRAQSRHPGGFHRPICAANTIAVAFDLLQWRACVENGQFYGSLLGQQSHQHVRFFVPFYMPAWCECACVCLCVYMCV